MVLAEKIRLKRSLNFSVHSKSNCLVISNWIDPDTDISYKICKNPKNHELFMVPENDTLQVDSTQLFSMTVAAIRTLDQNFVQPGEVTVEAEKELGVLEELDDSYMVQNLETRQVGLILKTMCKPVSVVKNDSMSHTSTIESGDYRTGRNKNFVQANQFGSLKPVRHKSQPFEENSVTDENIIWIVGFNLLL